MNMSDPDIPFETEKKAAVTSILDNSVKNLGLQQSSYVEIKSNIFDFIESPTNAHFGLSQIVTITSETVKKNLSVPIHGSNSAYLKTQQTNTARYRTSISRPDHSDETDKTRRSPNEEHRSRLIKLIELLPPYLEDEEVTRYKKIIETIAVGPRTESASAKSTGDIDYEIVLEVSKTYKGQFDEILKSHPRVFIDIDPDSGKEKDLSRQLRQNLESVNTIREFLSLKDLISRHIEHYKDQMTTKKSIKERLMFWK